MEWIKVLLYDHNSIAHIVLLYAFVIAIGVALGKIKFFGVSLGVTFVLFTGIFMGHFGFKVNSDTLHFIQEFGLILFVFCIGLQVGPSFFSSFKKGGMILNLLAVGIVILNIGVALGLFFILDGRLELPMIIGTLYGAVTNTPGLGAAQEALNQLSYNGPEISLGYACAYPLGVIGIIGSTILLRHIFKINLEKEEHDLLSENQSSQDRPERITIRVINKAIVGKKIKELAALLSYSFVCSRLMRDSNSIIPEGNTVIQDNDYLLIVCSAEKEETVVALLGEKVEGFVWTENVQKQTDNELELHKILITKSNINGKSLGDLQIRALHGVNVTRVARSGVDLLADSKLKLQVGDSLTVVGTLPNIKKVERLLGNSLKRLDHPNIITIFIGIFVGILFGSLPFQIPGIPMPIKLGLAGGPLVIAILIGRFGHHFKLVTYTTQSANLMLREVGIALFLASVGLKAGENFINTVVQGDGILYVGIGFLITVVPILVIATIGRLYFKINYFTLMGLIAGSNTDPPALAYANSVGTGDAPSVGYSTVYPLTMFLRILTGQLILVLMASFF
ncbi:putative transporter [Bacteroides propionicifaciens]|uniref:putative transporter n=1 Tax=Bacteroides propionicifaciens TaxID=392838 RepID=UPI00037742C5|nr:putative transporter [Bacteroides propionicifaciens]